MKTIEQIEEAFLKIHRLACDDPRGTAYMSIPADPERDADLIVSAAIEELKELRSRQFVVTPTLVSFKAACPKCTHGEIHMRQEGAYSMKTACPVCGTVWSMSAFDPSTEKPTPARPCEHRYIQAEAGLNGADGVVRCVRCAAVMPNMKAEVRGVEQSISGLSWVKP